MLQFSILQSTAENAIPRLVSNYTNIQYVSIIYDKYKLVGETNLFPNDNVFYRHYYCFKDGKVIDILDMICTLVEEEQ